MTEVTTAGTMGYADALACLASVHRALDASDASAVVGHFTADAVWHRPDRVLCGRAEIEAMVRARDTTGVTAHIVGNLAIEPCEGGWTSRYLLSVYVGRDGIGQFAALLSCVDRLVVDRGSLRIAEKQAAPLLRPPA